MGRDPRFFTPHTLVETTTVTFQNRYLTRPSDELNDVFLGVLGLAQAMYEMPICGVVTMSTHWHQLLVPEDPEHLADFMEFVNGNLSNEIGRLHGWKGSLWHDHGATALIEGTPLVGTWYKRTREYAASQLRREKDVDPEQFASEQKVVLSPLPCWEHLHDKTWRCRVGDLVADIDEEGARERKRERKTSLGVDRILRVRPTRRPKKVEKSPRPRYHAVTELPFKRWREAFGEVLKAYREASARLREGDLSADFPEGTFPTSLPFVPFTETLIARARGQPA